MTTMGNIAVLRRAFVSAGVLVALALITGQTVFNQESHKVTVQLVLVDLIATDKDGHPVTDLTKDDLEITEDGKRVEIRSLDFIALGGPAAGPPQESTLSEARKKRLTVVFDSMNTVKRILDRSKGQIVDRLLDLIRSGYEVMVFELTEKGEMRILQPPTSDEQLIRQAVLKASGSLWVERAEDMLGIPRSLLEDAERNRDRFYLTITKLMYLAETRRRLEASVTAFLSVLNVIKDVPGRKPVLLISGGFPYLNIDEIQVAKINDPFRVLRTSRLTTADEIFRHLISFANSHNISIYALYSDDFLRFVLPDIALDHSSLAYELAEIKKSELYNLSDLATGTMGVPMVGADKFREFEGLFRSDLTSYYELSYIPPRKKADGRYHKIAVRARRAGVALRHRPGYFDYEEGQKESLLFASAAFNPSLFNDIPFAAQAVPVAVGAHRYVLWMLLALPVRGFLLGADESQETKDIKIGLSLIDEENHLALSAQINTPLRLSPEFRLRLAKARHFGFNACSQEMTFEKARYRAVVALYDQDNKVMGAVESTLEVPDPSPEAAGNIVVAVLGQIVESSERGPADFLISPEDGTLRFQGYRFYPLGLNELGQKQKIAIYLQVRGVQDEGLRDLNFSASRDGEVPDEIKAQEIARSKNGKANVWNVVSELNLSLLRSGNYVLQIIHRAKPGGEETVVFRLPFRLL